MSVIIRLQNLPWSANSLDIRHYFRGLSIPEGGVHIVGGEMGDAFIAFSTDEDARQAMMLAGGKIKEVQISLMLSSRNEMQKVIEAARQASMTNSLAQLLGSQNVPPLQMGQQAVAGAQMQLPQQQHLLSKERRESRDDKKDSSDMSTSSYDTVRRDKKEKSRSRSRDRMRKDRRDRDRDRERRRRSRSRSRSRDRRRRRSHSRSRGRDGHGRDRERKDLREDMKKDKELAGPLVNSLQDATNQPNLDILNPNQWRMIPPANLSQNAPVLNSLTNLDILRNFAGAKPLLQGGGLGVSGVPLLGNVDMNDVNQGDLFQGMSGNEDMGFGGGGGGRGRGGDYAGSGGRRDNRDGYRGDADMNGGNARDSLVPDGGGGGGGRGGFRNYDDGNGQGFQGSYPYGEANLFDMANNFTAFQRNGSDGMGSGNRFGNFNTGDGYPPMLGSNSREPGGGGGGGRGGLMDFPMGMPSGDGFGSRSDRFDSQSRDDRVDEFGRSIQLRNRKNNVNDDSYKDDDFQRGQSGNFPSFQNRYPNSSQSTGPQPLMRSRETWPPGRGGGDGFSDRRGFRGGFDEGSRTSFRSDFSDGSSRFQGRSRRDDFHGRDRGRFSEKGSRDDGKYERDCCVEIRGLAPNIAYGDVRRPFNILKVIIKDIKFFDYGKHDKKCRLKFLNYENKKKALQNPKKIVIEGKQVQLLHINDSEFEDCIDEGVKRTDVRFSDDEDDIVSPADAYVQVRDLLPEHTENDVAKILSPAATDKIVLENSPDGKTKTALVKFSKPVDAKVALGTPCRSIGDKSVMLASLSQRDFADRVKKIEKSNSSPGVGAAGAAATSDTSATATATAPDSTGQEPEKTDSAMLDEDEDEDEEEEEEGKEAASKDSDTDCIIMKNLPFEANDRDICDFFSDIGLVPKRIHLMLDVRGQPSGDAFCEFAQAEQAQTACSKNGMPMGKNNLVVQQVSRAEVNDALGVKSEGNGAGGAGAQGANGDGFGKPQCVVALENIPFRAGVFEIINFFGWSYKLTEDDIFRRYNDRGQPTGDARVSFRTPEDALKAVRFLNNRNMMGRVIRMKIL